MVGDRWAAGGRGGVAEEMPQVLGAGHARGELRDLPIGVAEAGEDRLNDRRVVEVDVRCELG